MSNIITAENLTKSFKDIKAVRGIDFYVETGKLFAFLGPNGAGKSTTIDILCTLLTPDAGNVTIDGHILGRDDEEIRRKIGVVFQNGVLDPLLTVRENMTVRAKLYGAKAPAIKSAVTVAADAANVTEFIDRPYGKLSGGQKRRADIARALVNTPKILFLDEPTTGLDPKTKESVWRTVSELQKNTGMTVFLTTHYMEEAASADYIIIIDCGEIAAKGTPYDLQVKYSSDRILVKPKSLETSAGLFTEAGFVQKNGIFAANLASSMDAIPLLSRLSEQIESFEVIRGSMEDVFLKVIGETGGNSNA